MSPQLHDNALGLRCRTASRSAGVDDRRYVRRPGGVPHTSPGCRPSVSGQPPLGSNCETRAAVQSVHHPATCQRPQPRLAAGGPRVDGGVGTSTPVRRRVDPAPRRPPGERAAPGSGWSAASRGTRTAPPAAGVHRPPRAAGRTPARASTSAGAARSASVCGTRKRIVATVTSRFSARRVPLDVVALQQRLRCPSTVGQERASTPRSPRPARRSSGPRAPNGDIRCALSPARAPGRPASAAPRAAENR
jgi:hypothetical protein